MPGIILGLDLNHTLLIHSHGIDLHGVDSDTLIYQVSLELLVLIVHIIIVWVLSLVAANH